MIEFLLWLHNHAPAEVFGSLCATLWAGWLVWNKFIFEGNGGDPVTTAAQFNKMVADYNQYNTQVQVTPQSHILRFQYWVPPDVGWVKVNFDAHVRDNARRGLGTVIRDHNGKLLAAGVRSIDGRWSVEACEAAAGLFGVELALRLGYEYVHLEGDAMNVVQAIETKKEGCSPLHHLYDCIAVLGTSQDLLRNMFSYR